jgi:hypothetical protein
MTTLTVSEEYGTIGHWTGRIQRHLTDYEGTTGSNSPSIYLPATAATEAGGWSELEEQYLKQVFSYALKPAIEATQFIATGSLENQAQLLISSIKSMMSLSSRFGLDASIIPQIHADVLDDGSLLMEWILPNFRLGFGLEEDSAQSSWFLITDESLGSISCSGSLTDDPPLKLVWWLTSFLVLNS